MERREFLQAASAVAGVTAMGGVLWGRAAFARSQFTQKLVGEASPLLVTKEHSEITSIPFSASEEMKLWFTGACLNSAQFVDYICSEGFATRLGQFASPREREMCVENEFFARVLSHSSIYQRVELVAQESGAILDRNWQSCCDEIASTWKLKLNAKSDDLSVGIQSRLDSLISIQLDEAISRSANVADRPSAISSAIGVGKASLMVLRLLRLPPPYNLVAIPAFALTAITHFANFVVGLLFQDSSGAKVAISDRIALLGNRVASEFNAELKSRIADLHTWQNEALRTTAEEYAHASIGII
ncbi:MAG: hypothetical protein CME32_13130 [Gimesia sp.]|nr:hypothetical protein [Gimesia sp.]